MTVALDLTDRDAVLERARYRSTLFGRGGGRWHCDGYLMRTLAEQTAGAEDSGRSGIPDYTRATLTEEIPVEHVARCIRLPDPPTERLGCGGKGYHWAGDTDYPCHGCYACRAHRDPMVIVAWWVGVMVWGWATSQERARLDLGVRGMQSLASIGAAIAAALSPGLGVGQWLTDTVSEWNRVVVGRWYQVAGRRGKAKEHRGAEGEVVRVEEASGFRGSRGTLRAALRTQYDTRWIWVPASTLEPMHEPEDACRARLAAEESKAERARRPAFEGAKGDAVYVIDGPNAGKNGAVMWLGVSRGEQRVGVRFGPGEKNIAWCSAVDVVGDLVSASVDAMWPVFTAEEIAMLAEGHSDALGLGDRLEERGLAGLAAAWRGPIPVKKRRRAGSGHPRRAMTYQRGRVGY